VGSFFQRAAASLRSAPSAQAPDSRRVSYEASFASGPDACALLGLGAAVEDTGRPFVEKGGFVFDLEVPGVHQTLVGPSRDGGLRAVVEVAVIEPDEPVESRQALAVLLLSTEGMVAEVRAVLAERPEGLRDCAAPRAGWALSRTGARGSHLRVPHDRARSEGPPRRVDRAGVLARSGMGVAIETKRRRWLMRRL